MTINVFSASLQFHSSSNAPIGQYSLHFPQSTHRFSSTIGSDVLSCKGVESTTPKLQGSSFICGTFGRTPKRKNILPAQEQFVSACGVIKCEVKFFQKLFKMCSDLPPVFLLYIEGCNLNTIADNYTNQLGREVKRAITVIQPIKLNQREEPTPCRPL